MLGERLKGRPVHYAVGKLADGSFEASKWDLYVRACDKRTTQWWTSLNHTDVPADVTCRKCITWIRQDTERKLAAS